MTNQLYFYVCIHTSRVNNQWINSLISIFLEFAFWHFSHRDFCYFFSFCFFFIMFFSFRFFFFHSKYISAVFNSVALPEWREEKNDTQHRKFIRCDRWFWALTNLLWNFVLIVCKRANLLALLRMNYLCIGQQMKSTLTSQIT